MLTEENIVALYLARCVFLDCICLLPALIAYICLFVWLQVVSDAMLAELKQCFMEAYDDNQDGKIDIREVDLLRLKRYAYKDLLVQS